MMGVIERPGKEFMARELKMKREERNVPFTSFFKSNF